ncbi:L-serine ammonia-lyase [Agrocybe pediades]|nr:L-serine ammonia-lyase [Agrocybe pediades]
MSLILRSSLPRISATAIQARTLPSCRPYLSSRVPSKSIATTVSLDATKDDENSVERQRPEHAVISTFDLFSIGVGPSSSHTVGPMRAAKIFITDLIELNLLEKVANVKISLYGSLAATGKGHHTPQAILLGLEGSDPETIETGTIPSRYAVIQENKTLLLGGHHRISYDMNRDMLWRWDQVLKTHPNGMRFSCFDENGDMLATNEYFSVGGGFVVNEKTKVDENLFYKGVDKTKVHGARLHQSHSLSEPEDGTAATTGDGAGSAQSNVKEDEEHPPYPFDTGNTLLALTRKHNMTIAQIVHDNEKYFGYTDEDIHNKIMRIWEVMDECIRTGVSTSEKTLPGRLGLRRRAPILYRRLMRGFYPGVAAGYNNNPAIAAGWERDAIRGPQMNSDGLDTATDDLNPRPHTNITGNRNFGTNLQASKKLPRVIGSFDHALLPTPPRKTTIPAVDFLSCYAIAVNEVNASGGRIVTSPTNGAAGVIPAVLKYIIEFVSDDPEKSIQTFLLTASAIGMLFKRGSTISAAEGGCQAEVGVACSMASAGFAACMGASPETVLQAAEIGIEHNLGLTCDPIDGLVQVPCIERNSLGAVKAITAAQLSMASDGVYSVTLDEAIEAMRLTAADMSVKYKETSLSGLATTVKIPLTVPAC